MIGYQCGVDQGSLTPAREDILSIYEKIFTKNLIWYHVTYSKQSHYIWCPALKLLC